MESKAQRIFLDVSEDRGEPSGYFVRNDLFISVYKECVLVHQDHHLHEDMNALKYASQFAMI